MLSAKTGTSGIYLTKIDLFFSTKDTSLPVTVELREVDPISNGITSKVVPFSRTIIPASDINTSDDGSAATPIYFPSPVYLTDGMEYAVVIIPGGTNPNYNVFTAVLGEEDIATGSRVTEQPATGTLFISANMRIWTPVLNEDLKFTAYYAEFNKSQVGNLIVKNENQEIFTLANTSGTYSKIGEIVHGETTIRGTFANTKTLFVNEGRTYIHGATSNAVGTVTSFSSNQIKVKNVTLSKKFQAGEFIRVRNDFWFTGAIVGNSTGNITSAVTPVGRISLVDTSNYANTKLYVANSSYVNISACTIGRYFSTGTFVRGQTDGYSARIATTDNLTVDNMNLFTASILPSNTSITAYAKMATGTTTKDADYFNININGDTDLNSSRYIYSYSSEATTLSSNSAVIKYELDCRNIAASPAIDLRRIALIVTNNLISSNAEIGSSEDFVSGGGISKSRYITRTVALADGQDAEDLRVYLSAYKPIGSDVHVYYKILNSEDSDAFGDSRWIPMVRDTGEGFTAETRYSSSENRDDIFEMTYKTSDFNNTSLSGANTTNSNIIEYRNSRKARFIGFKYFAVKIVLTNDTSANPPRVRELRAIALQR